ncbi:MAG TPA: M1 family metallopeptidase, partial [Acidobacteriota bacterium]|nr:M1 family metallopeptidase [Acidobacteriota bacterium]
MKLFFILAAVLLVPVTVLAQRLPRTVLPVHYDLTFAPHLAEETFDGSEVISISVQQPTRRIVLNALEIEFKNVLVESDEHQGTESSTQQMQRAEVQLDPQKEFAILTVPQPVPPGPARIHIEYTGRLNRELRGFYIGEAAAQSLKAGQEPDPPKTRKYAASQGEATDIRRAFPAFDEPGMKATFSIAMIVDKTETAISNSAVESDTPGPGPNQHTIRFADTPRLSSYLVALLAGDFHCIKDEAKGVPLGVCALGSASSLGGFALDMTKGILTYYDDYYGIPYPFDKLDQIGIPDFEAGAMENAGAIVYRESALLSDPNSASLTRRKGVAATIAHEIAHMWFGDLVTMRWWNDVWLNEGFATWMTSKPLKKLRPEWRFDLEEAKDTREAMDTDVLSTTRPIRANGETSREIDALFDSIAYQKTASLLRMVESYIGEENFRAGVNSYLNDHAWENAESYDFFDALASVSQTSADEVMNRFVNQAGVPVVAVQEACDGKDTVFHLRQRRFLEKGGPESGTSQLWVLPVCPASTAGDQPCQLLREREQTLRFKGCDGASFLNRDGDGYFVTEYEPETEAQMIRRAEALPERERMTFARDEWYLVRAGTRPIGTFLQLVETLSHNRTPELLESLLTNLQYTADYMVMQSDTHAYESWVQKKLRASLHDLGPAAPVDPEDLRLARGDLWKALAVTAKDPDAIAEVRRMAENYLHDRGSLDPNIATVVLEAAAAGGDAKLFDEITSAYRAGGTPEELRRFLYALAE